MVDLATTSLLHHTFPETAVQLVRLAPGVERADNLLVWFVTVNLRSGAGSQPPAPPRPGRFRPTGSPPRVAW